MRILIVKISSIGDLIHTFPAITEAKNNFPDLIIDWLVDDKFIEIVKLHKNYAYNSCIQNIIAIPLRDLKKSWFTTILKSNITNILAELRKEQYDIVIDAQGLIKSAIFTKLARSATKGGFDYNSIKEPMASFFYSHKFYIDKNLHAIDRLRQLFAKILNYDYDPRVIYYGLDRSKLLQLHDNITENLGNYIVFLYGTTWETKHWEPKYWDELAKLLYIKNVKIITMFVDVQQQNFSQWLVDNNPNVVQLPKLDLLQAAKVIANSKAVVTVDTGFGHLAASFDLPVIGIYGATSVIKSGILSYNSINLGSKYHCAPCFKKTCLEYQRGNSLVRQPCYLEITPNIVMQELSKLLGL